MELDGFKQLPLLGILRGIKQKSLYPLLETIISAGLKTIEITMNTENAADLIRNAKRISKNHLTIGAGTVLCIKDLKIALGAGATFIVTPVLIPEVTKYCVKKRIPIFPGALTPQEIFSAWQAGATMVKVFPSGVLGPGYFKEIHGPFPDLALLACGGVTVRNLRAYFANGASAASFGASVFRNEWLKRNDYQHVKKAIESFIHEIKNINITKSLSNESSIP